MKFRLAPILTSFILILTSCVSKHESGHIYTVVRDDFVDEIVLEGTAEAVHVAPVICTEDILMYDAVIIWMADDGAIVKEGDTVCLLESKELSGLEQTVIELIATNRAAYDVGVANLNSQYAQLEAEARSNALQAEVSTLDSLKMLYYSASQRRVAELELEKTRIQQQKLDRNLAVTRIVNETEMRKLEMQLRQSEDLRELYDMILSGLVITAPASGMFIRGENYNTETMYQIGDAVNNEVLATIPDLTQMQVVIQAPEQAFKRLEVGQPVTYSYDAMPGILNYGKIVQKAAKGHPMNRRSTVMLYEVIASIDSAETLPVSGFSANCKVCITALQDTFPIPLVAVFDKDSTKVVYIREGKQFVEQEVVTGKFSSHEVVVAEGLYGGERLALIRPAESDIKEHRKLTEVPTRHPGLDPGSRNEQGMLNQVQHDERMLNQVQHDGNDKNDDTIVK